jgi:L-ascorbate metabolism protein UlaG (beta-lactamase superfamily)
MARFRTPPEGRGRVSFNMPPLPPSDHFDGHRFHNVDPEAKTRPLSDVWKWSRARRPAAWPRNIVDEIPPLPSTPAGEVISVTFIGHSTFLLRWGGITLLTDPVFAPHAGPWGRTGPRRARGPAYPLDQLPKVDLVLQSHNHYDHLDLGTHEAIGRRDGARIVTPLGNGAYLPKRVRGWVDERDWWGVCEPLPGVRVTVVPAQHFSARTPWDRDRALWGGLVVECGGRTVYFAGDSGYCRHFGEIGERFPTIDLALVPIGAYDPRWFMRPVHMDPEEALKAHLDLRARRSIAMHFGTFQLTDEPIDEPAERLRAAMRAAGVADASFQVPRPGETILIG